VFLLKRFKTTHLLYLAILCAGGFLLNQWLSVFENSWFSYRIPAVGVLSFLLWIFIIYVERCTEKEFFDSD